MEEYVVAALDRGLREIFFLEHLECGINYQSSTWLSSSDFAYYHREGSRLQGIYGDRLKIGLGVEVGYNPERLDEILAFLAMHKWDRIGLSYHYHECEGKHYNVVSMRKNNLQPLAELGVGKVITAYFATLLEAIEKVPAQVVCHLDAVLRHQPDVYFSQEHLQQTEQVLRAMREKSMALEVNTSGYPHKDAPYPSGPILQKAIALGLPLVAGSDAHRPQDVGRYFEKLPELVAKLSKSNDNGDGVQGF